MSARSPRFRSAARPPRRTRTRSFVAAVAFASATLLTASCGLGTAGGYSPSGTLAGPLAQVPNLDGTHIAVGSKNFTEQLVLGKLMVILLKSAGADVADLTNIPGSASARQAQLEGQVDTSWEYTGTAWISYLGESDPIPDEKKQFEAVKKLDYERNHLVWLAPAPMNNTYAFATRADTAKKLGITSLDQLKDVPKNERTFCVDAEFAARNDGFQPMLKDYGLTYGTDVASSQVKLMTEGAIYAAIDSGQCTFGEVFTTDGRIKALDLSVLEDTKNFFPKYNVSAVIREETLQKSPQLRDLIVPVTNKLTNDTMIDLNARVDVNGEEPVDVAWDWLRKEGFVQAK